VVEPLVYKGADLVAQPAVAAGQDDSSAAKSSAPKPEAGKKTGVFSKIGRFFKRIFGAE
jgi:hypothetical protein